jgi:GTPase SAR1 family protein
MNKYLKCIVLGEPQCGKSSMLSLYMTGDENFKNNENTRYSINFNAKLKDLGLNSTELNEFKQINNNINRNESYSIKLYEYQMNRSNEEQFLNEHELDHPDVLLYCYKSGSRLNDNLIEMLKLKYGNNVPVVLASCKADIVESSLIHNLPFETTSEKLKSKFGADCHLYCSNVRKLNIDKVFNETFKLAVRHRIKSIIMNEKLKQQQQQMTQESVLRSSTTTTKLFIGLDEEKVLNSIAKQLFTLFGFALFLFYMITSRLAANKISFGELNLIKGVLDDSFKTYNSMFLH